MTGTTQAEEEAVGANYDAAMLMQVRDRTWQAIHDIAAAITPGMTRAVDPQLQPRGLRVHAVQWATIPFFPSGSAAP